MFHATILTAFGFANRTGIVMNDPVSSCFIGSICVDRLTAEFRCVLNLLVLR
jgi:hypothetical protein